MRKENQNTDEAAQDECDEFYRRHRGGSGNVILVQVIAFDGDDEFLVFSSIEKAQEFLEVREEAALIMPRIVDFPDYGNVTVN